LNRIKRQGWQRLSRLGSEAAWVFAGQLLSLAGTLIGVRILTEYLSPSAYGALGLSLTIAALFTEVVIGGLVGAFARFYSIAAGASDIEGYVRGVRVLLFGAVGIAVVLLLAALPWLLMGFEGLTWQTGLVVALFAVLFGSNAAINAAFNGARRRRLVALNSVVDAWLKIVLAVAAIHLFGPDASSVLIAYAASLTVVMVHQIYRLKRLAPIERTTTGRRWSKEMFLFAWPASVWGVFTWAQLVADRWALQTFYSTAEVGLYSVVLQLGYFPMTLLMGMLGTFLTPIFFQRTNDQQAHIDQTQDILWRRIFFWGIGFSLLVAVIAWLLKGLVFDLLTAQEFRQMAKHLPVMALAGGIYGTASLLQVRLMSHMKMVHLAKILIVSSIVGVVLTLALAATWGISGVVIAKLLFAIVFLCGLAFATVFYRRPK
jgi:O-antigen/teichoic acid export membrane protein